jgi:hypothetical protein
MRLTLRGLIKLMIESHVGRVRKVGFFGHASKSAARGGG